MAKESSLIGTYLGKYKIEQRLGRGGMAEVYKAYQSNLERYVAIKIMHSFLAEDGDFLNRFQREALAMAATKHPNIASVYDFEAEDESYYIVMEYLSGGSLKDRIGEAESQGNLVDLGVVVRVIIEMAEALSFAHSVGMIHRDIKPANIMFNEHGSAVLTDFGIAKLLGGPSHTATGSMIGTPAYMSPEQGLGEPGDERSDIYSLGVLFYHLATGRLPHEGDTPLSVVLKHVNDTPTRPCALNESLPTAIEDIILHAMEKDPDKRYQRAGAMARELRVIAQQESLDGLYNLSFTGGRDDALVSPVSGSFEFESDEEAEFYRNLITPVPGESDSKIDRATPLPDDFEDSIEFFDSSPEPDTADSFPITNELFGEPTAENHPTKLTKPPSQAETWLSPDPLESDSNEPELASFGEEVTADSMATVLRSLDSPPANVSQEDIGEQDADATPPTQETMVSKSAAAVPPVADYKPPEDLDVSSLNNVLADLSVDRPEPGTGADLLEAISRQDTLKRARRQRRVGAIVRNVFIAAFVLGGIVAGYYIWTTYISSDATSTAVDDLNQQINELTGGTTAEDVDLSQYVAEEQAPREPMMLSQITGTAIVLEISGDLPPRRPWRTIIEQRLADGSWQGVDRFQSRFNSNQKSVWPVELFNDDGATLYRWVVIDDEQPAEDRRPVAISDPFVLPAEGDENLIVTVEPLAPPAESE